MATMMSPVAMPEALAATQGDPGEESLIILQSLVCLLRETNLLSRADVEELCRKVDARARGDGAALPCCPDAAQGAAGRMQHLSGYIGQRYGGRHGRN